MKLPVEMQRRLCKDNVYTPHSPADSKELFDSRWGYIPEGEETIFVEAKTENQTVLGKINNIALIKWGSNLMIRIGEICIETPPIQHIETNEKYIRFDIVNGASFLFRRLGKF